MSKLADDSHKLKDELIQLIDADTESFRMVMEAFKLPNKSFKFISINCLELLKPKHIYTILFDKISNISRKKMK